MTTRALQFDILLTPIIDYRSNSVSSGYTVYFYSAGTSNAKNVWTEKEKSNAYTSREIGSDGTVQVYGDGVYKLTIKDTDGTTVYEWDNVKCQANTYTVQSKSDTYTATADDDFINCNGTFTLNLAAVSGFTHPLIVKNIGTGTVTIDPNASETIDGNSTIQLTQQNESVTLDPDTVSGVWRRANYVEGLGALTLLYRRAKFTYNGGATAYTIKASNGVYHVKDKAAIWESEITTGAISTPSADTWYYLYLDYSAMTVGAQITSSEVVWSSTAPTYNTTYGGMYNGDDRCIAAALTNSTPDDILEFHHDGGDQAFWADSISGSGTSASTWTDFNLSFGVPGFSTRANATFSFSSTNTTYLYWRTNGQSGSSGHIVGQMGATTDFGQYTTAEVITDSSQIIECLFSPNPGTAVTPTVNGWYFPAGM